MKISNLFKKSSLLRGKSLMTALLAIAFIAIPFAGVTPVQAQSPSINADASDPSAVDLTADYQEDIGGDVGWAVRQGSCDVATVTVYGNVDGHDDPYTWDGQNFSATMDAESEGLPEGEYCFVVNPTAAGEPTLETTFQIDYTADPTINADASDPQAVDLTADYQEDIGGDVEWAVRSESCDVATTTVYGNVDGHDDPYTWDGQNFSATMDAESEGLPEGEYCFVVNPTASGEETVETTFQIDYADEPTASVDASDPSAVDLTADYQEDIGGDVGWAVRQGSCDVATVTVYGNVDGHDDPYTWDGQNFSATMDAESEGLPEGDYCFVINPDAAGEPTLETTFQIDYADQDPTPNPGDGDNACLLPDTLGDSTTETIEEPFLNQDGDSSNDEPTLQDILDNNSVARDADTDQTQYQVWAPTSDVTSFTVDVWAHNGAQPAVLGYYVDGDLNTFTPIFATGSVDGFGTTTQMTSGSVTVTDVAASSTIEFAIKTQVSSSVVETFATRNSLNHQGEDHALAYNHNGGYVLAFEDLVYSQSDMDFNDMVVEISGLDCEDLPAEPDEPQEPAQCTLETRWAEDVTSFDQGDTQGGDSVPAERSDETEALGSEDDSDDQIDFVSLGFGGTITLDMGVAIPDEAGDDLRLYETSFGDPGEDEHPETARLEVSQDGSTWVTIDEAALDGTIDIAGSGFDWIQYVRVTDTTDSDDFSETPQADGFDLAGVEGLHCGQVDDDEEPADDEDGIVGGGIAPTRDTDDDDDEDFGVGGDVEGATFEPLECTPENITVDPGEEVTLRAVGGDGEYIWATMFDSRAGSDDEFTVEYDTPGVYAHAVRSGDDAEVCTVTVRGFGVGGAGDVPPVVDGVTGQFPGLPFAGEGGAAFSTLLYLLGALTLGGFGITLLLKRA